MVSLNSKRGPWQRCVHVRVTVACAIPDSFFHSSTDRLLSDPELSAAESPLADKKAPGSERAAERAAQQNNERARLAPRPSYVNMQVMHKRSFPLAVVLPPPDRGPGTLIPSAQRFV